MDELCAQISIDT